MEASRDETDSRDRVERRRFTWRTVFFGFTRSRRRAHRRDVDTDVIYVDWHEPWLLYLAAGTMFMSATDAFLTLQLIDRGMIEANPVMQAVMQHGTGVFASIKLAMTGFGILVLVFLSRARFLNRFKTGLLLAVFFGFYGILVAYELISLVSLSQDFQRLRSNSL